MIGYVTIGALNVEEAMPFYDAVLGAIGYERQFFDGGWAGYGPAGKDADTFICPPFDGQPARGGDGFLGRTAEGDHDAVAAAHAAALAHGGTDEGEPGPRPADSTTFYGAYVRDPTGNKIAIFTKP